MKNLMTIALFASLTFLMSFESNANDRNPWKTYKEVVHAFYNSNGQFQNFTAVEQDDFIKATELIKTRLEHANNERTNEKLKKINLTESIFKFVWNSKPTDLEIDINMVIPELPEIQ